MKLSAKQRAVIQFAQNQAHAPATELAKPLGLQPRNVRGTLERLLQDGLIHRSTVINLHKLGYSLYNMYFSLPTAEEKLRRKILHWITNHEGVLWLGEVGGEFAYDLTFVGRTGGEFARFLEELTDELGCVLTTRMMSMEYSTHRYGVKFLDRKVPPPPPVDLEEPAEVITVDDIDRKILRAFCNNPGASSYDMARELGLLTSTFSYRRKRLLQSGVIPGEIFLLNDVRLNFTNLHLLVYLKKAGKAFRQEFLNFCRLHPHIYFCIVCAGAWDYKVGFMAETREEAQTAIEQLRSRFDEWIGSVKILPTLSVLKMNWFPFST